MLTPIAPDLWGAERSLKLMPGAYLSVRMTLIRLPDGGLILHSPIEPSDALCTEVEALGTVAHLVAPNRMHHLSLGHWIARYPHARVYGAPGLESKRTDLTFHETLWDSPPAYWQDSLEQLCIQGAPSLNEVVFFHRASRTLLVTDLIFNLQETQGVLTPWLLRTTGSYRKVAQSRVWRWSTRDRATARACVERMLEWDIQRVVPAHGTVLEHDARPQLEQALTWMRRS